MKTTDLIPLILYQLVDGDKYGYEIVKQIEDCSNGGIVIKQPTLYSVLKKLEQGKFISSYWQDSEIGGKRHYYKLTDNGKSQLSTYPALEVLINEVLNEDVVPTKAIEVASSPASKVETSVENPAFNSNSVSETPYTFSTENLATNTFDITENQAKTINTFDITNNENVSTTTFDIAQNEEVDANAFDNTPSKVAEIETTDFSFSPASSLSGTSINFDDFGNAQDEKVETTTDFAYAEDAYNEEYSPIEPINLVSEQEVTPFSYGESPSTSSSVNIFDVIEPIASESEANKTATFEPSDNYINYDLNTIEELQKFDPLASNNQTTYSFDTTNENFNTSNPNDVDASSESLDVANEITTSIQNEPLIEQVDEVKITSTIKPEKVQEKSTKFTKKVKQIKVSDADNKLYSKLSPSQNILAGNDNTTENKDPYSPTIADDIEKIKYLNYVDFATDKSTIKRRKTIKKHITKCALTCASILIMLILSIALGIKYEFSRLYYVCAIICALVVIFYPAILVRNIPNLKLKYSTKQFSYSISRDFFIKLSLFLSLVILIFAYNLNQVVDVSSIFKTYNFSNFFSPIMLSFTIILDFVYGVICYKDYRK